MGIRADVQVNIVTNLLGHREQVGSPGKVILGDVCCLSQEMSTSGQRWQRDLWLTWVSC